MCRDSQGREETPDAEILRERAAMWAAALAYVSERYRLDDADALRHVRLHAINGPGMTQ
jgi:hypothetical protein